MTDTYTPAAVLEFDDLATMDVLAHPLRLKLIDALREPATVKEAAAELGVPVTRLYHHVNQLLDHGLLVVVEERPKGGMVERVLGIAAESFRPSKAFSEAYGDEGEAEVVRLAFRMAEAQMTEFAGVDREAPAWREQLPEESASVALSALRLDPGDLTELIGELQDLLARYSKLEGSLTIGFFHAVYPRITTHG